MKLITIITVIGAILATCDQDPYCGECNTDNICTGCWKAVLTNDKVCSPVAKTVEWCLKYASDGVCEFCDLGYHVDANGKCVKNEDPNCVLYQAGKGCLACQGTIVEINKTCAESQKCTVDNCLACSEEGSCLICSPNFNLDTESRTCVASEDSLKDCVYSIGKYCIACNYLFQNKNGKCEPFGQIAGNTQPPADNKPAQPPADNKPAQPPAGNKPAQPPADNKPAQPPADNKPAQPTAGNKPAQPTADNKGAILPPSQGSANKSAGALSAVIAAFILLLQ